MLRVLSTESKRALRSLHTVVFYSECFRKPFRVLKRKET